MEPLNFRILNIDFRTPKIEPEPFQMQEIHFKVRGNCGKCGNNAEINEFINRKKNEKDHFRIRKSSTKFHIKIRKWNFKKVLLKNDKSKNVLEIGI